MGRLVDLEKKHPLFWISTGCLAIALICVADAATGSEMAFALFYLVPIFLVTWFAGRHAGFMLSVVAAVAWFIADVMGGQIYSSPLIGYWNAAVRLGLFVMVPALLPALQAIEREKVIARIDDLTGIANRRHFFEAAQAEIFRSQRYKRPFTIAYIDLDGFKAVNDKSGHDAGDRLLRAIVARAQRQLRVTDLIARLGGDEFICLFPEIGHEAAQITVPKLQAALLDEMRQNGWAVTFSIGVLTYESGRITPDELVKRADDQMYSVKRAGKNAISYAVYATAPVYAPSTNATPLLA